MRRKLQVEPLDGYAPEIAAWLWAMEATRAKTKHYALGLEQEVVDWPGTAGDGNTIGSLLYHLAIVELGWLLGDTLMRPDLIPEEEFPYEPFTDGRITRVVGVPLAEHVARLDRTRATFLRHMRDLPVEEWSRLRDPEGEDYSLTPAWMVFHLIEHEAGHAAQIAVLRKRARAALR